MNKLFELIDMQQMGDNVSLALVIESMLKAQRAQTLRDVRAWINEPNRTGVSPVVKLDFRQLMCDLGIEV